MRRMDGSSVGLPIGMKQKIGDSLNARLNAPRTMRRMGRNVVED